MIDTLFDSLSFHALLYDNFGSESEPMAGFFYLPPSCFLPRNSNYRQKHEKQWRNSMYKKLQQFVPRSYYLPHRLLLFPPRLLLIATYGYIMHRSRIGVWIKLTSNFIVLGEGESRNLSSRYFFFLFSIDARFDFNSFFSMPF